MIGLIIFRDGKNRYSATKTNIQTIFLNIKRKQK